MQMYVLFNVEHTGYDIQQTTFFFQKIGFDISCKLSPLRKLRKILSICRLLNLPTVVKVKQLIFSQWP